MARARKLISGAEQVEKQLKSKKVCLVIVAIDATDSTQQKLLNKCNFTNTKIVMFGTKNLIGKYIGKEERAVIGVLDINFANRIFQMIEEFNNQNGGEAIGKSPSV